MKRERERDNEDQKWWEKKEDKIVWLSIGGKKRFPLRFQRKDNIRN